MTPSETNEQRIAHAEIRDAIAELMRAVSRNNAALVGFVFGTDPALLVRFGNLTEKGPALAEVLLKASELCEDRERSGKVINERLSASPREED